jgi:5'-nucleotidase
LPRGFFLLSNFSIQYVLACLQILIPLISFLITFGKLTFKTTFFGKPLFRVFKVKPDLCVSGINHGANSSVNVVYAGTMSAAIEGGIHGVPSIGFSLLNHKWNADFSHIKEYIKIITLKTLNNGLPKKVVLNVNFPNVIKKEIKGIKICRQANTYWIEKFDKRKNPLGKNYYWLTGEFINNDKRIDTDEWALSNNYISIVPTQFDFTSELGLTKLNNWDFEK